MKRRKLLTAAAAFLALPAFAQGDTVRLVVPFGAGTTTHIASRVVADGMPRALQQTIIVDNKPGAGGSTGSDQVAKSPGDGRTILMGTVGTHAINSTARS